MNAQSHATEFIGFSMLPSRRWKDELSLTCPCGCQDIVITIIPGKIGYGLKGVWRIGDPGGKDIAKCESCGMIAYHKNTPA